MNFRTQGVRSAVGSFFFVGALVLACGSEKGSTFEDKGPDQADSGSNTDGGDGTFDPSGRDAGDPYANDPPPPWCGPSGQPEPPKPGGTEECPDDKNKPGCPCADVGKKEKCWTGLRANRELGVCKDGTAECQAIGENTKVWGPCEGEVLPKEGAKKGPDACQCFSAGQWKIANLVPCYFEYTTNDVKSTYATSSHQDGDGNAECPAVGPKPSAPPGQDWSTSTLKADCAGHFKLCYRVRVGDADKPTDGDCTVAETCTESDYVTANVEQPWPNLGSWLSKDDACVAKWQTNAKNEPTKSAIYGEMVVKGKSVRCDVIDDGAGNDFVFNRVPYCPAMCDKAENASDPACVECQQRGQGTF